MFKDKNIVEALNRVLTESFGCRCWLTGINIEVDTCELENVPAQGRFMCRFSFISKADLNKDGYSSLRAKIIPVGGCQTFYGTPNYMYECITCYKSSLQKELFQVMLEHS